MQPTPQGYRKIDLGPGAVQVLACKKCGALVILVQTHNDWHKKNG
jgi:hypothetical protein